MKIADAGRREHIVCFLDGSAFFYLKATLCHFFDIIDDASLILTLYLYWSLKPLSYSFRSYLKLVV